MNFLLYLTIGLFIFICVVLILIVLIQKGRGGGLSSAFGGAGGNTAFGSKTGDVLTWATSIIFGIFLLLAIALNLLADYKSKKALEAAGIMPPAAVEETAPVAPAVPATPAIPTTKPAQ